MRNCEGQGFPILINQTITSEHKSKSLFDMSVEIAHLPGDIVDPCPIHQTQRSAVELSQEALNLPCARLAGIFSPSVTSRLQCRPFSTLQCPRTSCNMRGGGALDKERRLASISHFMTDHTGFHYAHGAFEPKDSALCLPTPCQTSH